MTKVGFHEMLSYGHKPWDDDYRENRDSLQRAFDESDAHDQSNSGPSNHSETRDTSYSDSGRSDGAHDSSSGDRYSFDSCQESSRYDGNDSRYSASQDYEEHDDSHEAHVPGTTVDLEENVDVQDGSEHSDSDFDDDDEDDGYASYDDGEDYDYDEEYDGADYDDDD